MVATDSDIIQSSQQQPKNRASQSIERQSSIYSLTLDEFQHTLCESAKNFGSMNMDEFLNSIWTAKENQAQDQAQSNATNTGNAVQFPQRDGNTNCSRMSEKPSLSRQGSLSVPEPLCRKTVDEVWSEIHNNQQHNNDVSHSHTQNPNKYKATQKQQTFGEMTLEDFLIRAGIVRAQNSSTVPPQQPPCGVHQSSISHPPTRPSFCAGSMVAMGGGGGTYSEQPSPMGYGGRMGNESGGIGQFQDFGIGSPSSPVSSGGPCVGRVDGGNQFGLDMDESGGGKKRIIEGPVEKVVERRQRRMIKNRESAARSRARKQAYTVELEAELNQLKEENEHLKQALAEFEKRRQQVLSSRIQYNEDPRVEIHTQSKARKSNNKLRVMWRSSSCP